MEVQIDKSVYATLHYNEKGRFASYWHQIDEAIRLKPSSALEVGTGSGIVNKALKDAGIGVSVLDIDPELKPDLLGSVTEIPIADNSFDIAICCQVLEHIPYELFSTALKELRRVVKSDVIISLPDLRRAYRFDVELPVLGELKFIYSIPRLRPLKWEFNGEHYWNISCENYPLSRIVKDMEGAGFTIVKNYCVFEMPWHRFFVLRKS